MILRETRYRLKCDSMRNMASEWDSMRRVVDLKMIPQKTYKCRANWGIFKCCRRTHKKFVKSTKYYTSTSIVKIPFVKHRKKRIHKRLRKSKYRVNVLPQYETTVYLYKLTFWTRQHWFLAPISSDLTWNKYVTISESLLRNS